MRKQYGWLLIGVLMFSLCGQAKAQCTSQVYAAKAAMKGGAQIAPNAIFKGTLSNRHLINIALGIPESENPAPANMVLAVVSSCQCSNRSMWLVVWDTQASQVAAVIASAEDVLGDGTFIHSARTPTAVQSVVLMKVPQVGNFIGGHMTWIAKDGIPISGCVSKLSISVTGHLNANAYNPQGDWVTGLEILLFSGKITTQSPSIGIAVMD